jgi:hypothetical protein
MDAALVEVRGTRIARVALLSLQGFVAITALLGGSALIIGSVIPGLRSVLVPPDAYLAGSPFSTYVVPGVLLIVLVAAVHAVGFWALKSASRWAALLAAAGGFACLIWIAVQMIFIPFSFLQALYFAIGLAEVGLTMVLLGILEAPPQPHRSTYRSALDSMAVPPQQRPASH